MPTTVRFSDELVDLGFPSEEKICPSGSRYAKKLYCDGGSFVGPQGEVAVKASGGGWATEPSGIPDASTLNFFIDFPASASRNDVDLPEGRVFFRGTYWEQGKEPDGVLNMPDGSTAGVVQGASGVRLLDAGGITIKRNVWRNLWGALGDLMLILGRFSLSEKLPELRADETPQERAARERAEDAVRGRRF